MDEGKIIFLILFVIISGVKWLFEKIKSRGENQDVFDDSLEDLYEEFREEIRERQTKVQQPKKEYASPPPIPQTTIPQTTTPQPPTFQHASYDQQTSPTQEINPFLNRKVNKPKLTKEEKRALEQFRKQNKKPSRRRANDKHASLRELLRSPQSARQAIILHEVLGPPKSIKP